MEKVISQAERSLEAATPTPAEKLDRNLHKALDRHEEILDLRIDAYGDPQLNRLIADVSTATINSSIRVAEDRLCINWDGNRLPSPRLLAAIEVADKLAEEDLDRARLSDRPPGVAYTKS